VARGAILLEDGEGSTATLNATYAESNSGLRAAQSTTDSPTFSAQVGSGAGKFVFSVNNANFQSEWTNNLGSAIDATSVSTGALEFWFYFPGINFANRQEGKTIRTFQVALGNPNDVYDGFSVQVTPDDVNTLPGLVSEAWNFFHVELDDNEQFTSAGSTVNGTPLTIGGLSSLPVSGIGGIDWDTLDRVLFSVQHGGAGGGAEVEGFFGIDDAQLVPEPASATLLGLGLFSILIRRTH
jgi:hypothetical protein